MRLLKSVQYWITLNEHLNFVSIDKKSISGAEENNIPIKCYLVGL